MGNDKAKYDKIFEEAKNGGKHYNFYEQANNYNSKSLDNAIKSIKNNILDHDEKIKNPKNVILNWETWSDKHKEGQIKYWNKEVKIYKEQLEIIKRIKGEKI